jgi:hypothetical protein
MKTLAWTAVVALGSAMGCGGGSAGPSGGPVQLAQLPATWAQTVCSQNFKCDSVADIMKRTQTDCVQTDTTVWQAAVGAVQDGEAKGRLGYDAAQMGTCLATLAHESCAEWTTGLTHDVSCPEAFSAKVAVGGACQSDFECIMGHCDGATAATMTMPAVDGACKATLAHGAACVFGDACVSTDYCDGTTNVCAAKKTGGADCGGDDECGNSCNTDTNKCSGYAGCAVAPVSGRSTLVSGLAFGFIVAAARRRRRR